MGEKESTRSVGAGQATEIVERGSGGGDADESARTSNLNLSKSNIDRDAGNVLEGGGDTDAAINLNASKSNAN